MGKGLGFLLVSLGYGKIEGSARKTQLILLPGVLDIPFQLSSHPEKSVLREGISDLFEILETLFAFAYLASVAAPASEEATSPLTTVAPIAPPDLQLGEEKKAALRKLVLDAKAVAKEAAKGREALKERGLYVDLSEDGLLLSPQDLTKTEYERLLAEVEGEVIRLGPYIMEDLDDVVRRRAFLRMFTIAATLGDGPVPD